jgi:hypothetical protein
MLIKIILYRIKSKIIKRKKNIFILNGLCEFFYGRIINSSKFTKLLNLFS